MKRIITKDEGVYQIVYKKSRMYFRRHGMPYMLVWNSWLNKDKLSHDVRTRFMFKFENNSWCSFPKRVVNRSSKDDLYVCSVVLENKILKKNCLSTVTNDFIQNDNQDKIITFHHYGYTFTMR